MPNKVVIGAQWGDEGKAKIVDILSEEADIVVRYQGGANAGHTVVKDGKKYIFHLVPTGMLHPGKMCLIGNGVVVDFVELFNELKQLQDQGIDTTNRLKVSINAHVLFPFHKTLDASFEDANKEMMIGTTKRGIGPCYTDKINRCGIRVGDLFNIESLKNKLQLNLMSKNLILNNLYRQPSLSLDDLVRYCADIREKVKDMVVDSVEYLHNEIKNGKSILFEGAQGTLLDIDFGAYPYLTSSHPSIGGVFYGSGINPSQLKEIIGVVKAYQTRVGTGPFPTELTGELGQKIRELGAEYGATTGRPRRCGWLDLVSLRYSMRLNGFTQIALTKMDILDHLKEIYICKAYKLGSDIIDYYPMDTATLEKCTPIFEKLDGWGCSITGLTDYTKLPSAAKDYIKVIEDFVHCPVTMISTGAGRSEIIWRN